MRLYLGDIGIGYRHRTVYRQDIIVGLLGIILSML